MSHPLATHAVEEHRQADPPGTVPRLPARELGALASILGQAFVVGALVLSFGVLYDRLPLVLTAVALLGLAAACLLLAPRRVVRRIRFSVPLMALLSWTSLSWTWSVNPDESLLRVWTGVSVLVAAVAVGGVLGRDRLLSALRWSIRVTLFIVVSAVLTNPTARTSGDSAFTLEGWRGTFTDKNSLALYLVFALAVTVTADRGASRWLTSATIAALLVGSQSATGQSGAVLVLVLAVWLHQLRGRGPRASVMFLLSSLGLLVATVVAAIANLARLLEVYGKDADLTGRTDIWAAVLTAIRARPLEGHGLAALLNPVAPSETTLDLWRRIGFEAAHAHNGVLDLVGQLGLVGLVLFLVAAGTTVTAAAHKLKGSAQVAVLALVTIAAQTLMSVSENVLLGPWLLVLVLLQALLLADPGSGEDSGPDRQRSLHQGRARAAAAAEDGSTLLRMR